MTIVTRGPMKLLLALAAAGAIAVAGAPHAADAAGKKVVFAQGPLALPFIVMYVATAKGYFAEQGIDAELISLAGGAQAMSALLSDNAQVYPGIPSTAMKVVNAGQNVVVFASLMTQMPASMVVQGDIAKARGIGPDTPLKQRIASLKGLTIGVAAAGASPDTLVRYALQAVGIKPDSEATIAPIGGSAAMLGAFQQRRIDAFVSGSPTPEQAVREMGAVELVNYTRGEDESLRGFMFLGLIARPEWLEADPDRAVAVVRAVWQAERLIRERPDEAREAIRPSFSGLSPEMMKLGFDVNALAVPANPYTEEHGLELNRMFLKIAEGTDYTLPLARIYTNKYVALADGKR